MKRRFLLFLAISSWLAVPCSAQSWSNILVTSRATNWTTAGLPASFTDKGGSNVETTSSPFTPPTRTQFGSVISPSGVAATDLSNINTALGSCTDGTYIALASGTFLIQGAVNLYQHSCTLRGIGGTATILSLSGSGTINFGLASGGGSCSLTSGSGYSAGTSSLICNGLSGTAPAVGDIAVLNQCDSSAGCTTFPADNGSVWVCGDNGSCNLEGAGQTGPYHHQDQTVTITSVSNASGTYTLGISPALYTTTWAFANTPTLTWNAANFNCIGCGLEDLTLLNNGVTGQYVAQMDNSYASWTKGVRFLGISSNGTFQVSTVVNSLVFSNYFFPSLALGGGIPDTILQQETTDSLILNNIGHTGTLWVGQGGSVGNVYAYNYDRDAYTPFLENTMYEHHAYAALDLYEANELSDILHDATWGTHDLDTEFRNYLSCWDSPYTLASPNYRSVGLNPYQRFMNIIGNAMGTSGVCTSYQSTSIGSTIYEIDSGDSLISTTLMRWGDVSTVTQSTDTPANSGIRFVSSEVPSSLASPNTTWQNPVPSNDNLPCSFFLGGYTSTTCTSHPSGGTGLSFWKVCTSWTTFPTSCATTKLQPFPFAGPDVTSGPYVSGFAYDNPAEVAWNTLPIDTSQQHSYTITASSFASSGCPSGTSSCETLTVSGLPAIGNLIGGFRISGGSGSCVPSSGISYTGRSDNEILMIDSSTTTITYALASNPGSNACTGTMLFPDVRQFDERVYEADSGAVLLTPASENFGTVHLGSSSSPVTFTLTNSSAATASSITPTVTGGNPGDFSITNSGSGSCGGAGGSIASGLSCTFTVTFSPAAAGARSTTLSVSYSGGDGASPQTSALSGTGAVAATPTFSPVAGSYPSAQTVTITSSPSTVICWNTTGAPATNGSTGCSNGTLYSGPITVAVTETVYAVGGGTGYGDSPVGSAAYTIASVTVPGARTMILGMVIGDGSGGCTPTPKATSLCLAGDDLYICVDGAPCKKFITSVTLKPGSLPSLSQGTEPTLTVQ